MTKKETERRKKRAARERAAVMKCADELAEHLYAYAKQIGDGYPGIEAIVRWSIETAFASAPDPETAFSLIIKTLVSVANKRGLDVQALVTNPNDKGSSQQAMSTAASNSKWGH